jgi:hypothetical protein
VKLLIDSTIKGHENDKKGRAAKANNYFGYAIYHNYLFNGK